MFRRIPIETMALKVKKAKVRAIQRFISEATQDDEKMIHKYRCLVNDDMGEENGNLHMNSPNDGSIQPKTVCQQKRFG